MIKRADRIRMTHGGRNLVILGVVSTIVVLIATSISLMIYHNSGDIYLDRSRPGYLPDEEEIEEKNNEEEYDFEKSGKIDVKVIEEYLEKLQIEIDAVDAYEKPFSEDALSDERLGIDKLETEE